MEYETPEILAGYGADVARPCITLTTPGVVFCIDNTYMDVQKHTVTLYFHQIS